MLVYELIIRQVSGALALAESLHTFFAIRYKSWYNCFLSEWVPAERLIEGLRNPYLPSRCRLKFLKRLAKELTLEPRLQVAESLLTLSALLEQLAGDLEMRFAWQ
ncbi:MAG TPA: hypothetical protein V6D15_16200 [Oculatellaceae cyanobacterium]|jgi:hypothetical protein